MPPSGSATTSPPTTSLGRSGALPAPSPQPPTVPSSSYQTFGAACRGAVTSAKVEMVQRRLFSEVVRCSLNSSAVAPRPQSSWTAGGCPGSSDHERGRSVSASKLYVSLGSAAAQSAADDAKVALTAVDHIAITGVHPRAARTLARSLDVKPDVLIDDLASTVGNCGTAHLGLLLALALDRASPGDTIALLVLADGADAFVFRCTERLIEWREGATPQGGDQDIANDVSYTTYLRWRGHLHTEPPRRPPPDLPSRPPPIGGTSGSSPSADHAVVNAAQCTCRHRGCALRAVPSTQ